MSYSRWGSRGSGHWYTFWLISKDEHDADTAMFKIYTVKSFSSRELREDMGRCMKKVHEIDPDGDIKELEEYAREFLAGVDHAYNGCGGTK